MKEELAAYAHPQRMRMLELLGAEAMTLSQVAKALGTHPANLTRHMRRLVSAGLARLDHTRDTGRNLEKYYRAIARRFEPASVLSGGELAANALGVVRRAIQDAEARPRESALALLASLKLKPEDRERLAAGLEALIADYKARSVPDGEGLMLALALFPEDVPLPDPKRELRI